MIARILSAAAAALCLSVGAAAAAAEPVQVMVLGTYHFANPGMDLHNVKADSPLTPARQAELKAVADAIATFRPTRVMVERVSAEPDLAVSDYRTFGPDMLGRDPDETVQLGFRIARSAGLDTVHGVDEQPDTDEPDYFPYDKVKASAAKAGQEAVLTGLSDEIARYLRGFEARQKTHSIAQLLGEMNEPDTPATGMRAYYGLLGIGDVDDQAGADLNAMWFLRNAKIFGKLMRVAKPGDRIVLVYGAGHGFWLRHFASQTPGYALVDVRPYLAGAAR